ncbi:glycosyltransferase family 39 protein [Bradyrhizobium prioriisuperbiae]|uniref:glycosyltransferase family 39 protein n=1 Tax=Bradyrhizobium prioriisuperbiae TaxID=2854389 RepID=UPI0028EFD0E5|nr:glycosyltransferase family 39 protein [Bradyrhizobium prioritasuperba]
MTSNPGTSASPRTPAQPRAAWRRPFEAWLDGIEPGWAIPALLIGFVAIWMAFLLIAYINADLHPDILETWSIGRTFEWGNPKHPPLMGWVARLWSTVFPLTDWSFQLLAMVNAAFALWSVDLITRRFVRGDKRVIVLLLLMLLPAYQFHAQRFNANSILLAAWPLATYCFLRSFETRAFGWSVAAGLCAALAMLGKHYSVFLVAGFVLAAIAHPQRRAYFASLAPWVSALVGLAVLAPHLYWLAAHDFAPMKYAMTAHGGRSLPSAVHESGMFTLTLLAYFALPAVTWLLMIRTNLRAYASNLRRIEPGLLLLLLVFIGSILFPAVACITIGTDLPALWNLQGLFFVAIIAVAAATFAVDRFDTVNLAVFVLGLSLFAVGAAPFHAIYRNTHGYKEGRTFYRQAAEELTRRWHQVSPTPLPAVSGDDNLAFATAFYSPDHPRYARPFQFQYVWGLPRQSTLDKGWAALCFKGEADCEAWLRRLETRQTKFVQSEFVLTSQLWGRPGVSTVIVAVIAPPRDPSAEPVLVPERESLEDFSASRRHIQFRPESAIRPTRP